MLDAILVQTLAGKTELRHYDCIGADTPVPSLVSVNQPNRRNYGTQAEYDRAVDDAYACSSCSRPVKLAR